MRLAEKLHKIIETIYDKRHEVFSSYDSTRIEPKILRVVLRKTIMQALKITDPHTVNNWITRLEAEGIISCGASRPSNTTLYTLNIERFKEFLK